MKENTKRQILYRKIRIRIVGRFDPAFEVRVVGFVYLVHSLYFSVSAAGNRSELTGKCFAVVESSFGMFESCSALTGSSYAAFRSNYGSIKTCHEVIESNYATFRNDYGTIRTAYETIKSNFAVIVSCSAIVESNSELI